MSDNVPKDLKIQVEQAAVLQAKVAAKVKELKLAQAEIDETWKKVEEVMIENNLKSIKGEWGSITIAERLNFKIDDLSKVPRKFVKEAADTTKLAAAYKLSNVAPEGTEPYYSRYLTKRIK